MSDYVIEQTHSLQPNLNSYGVIRKMVSIHSEDRDITKWPMANEFQVELPVDYKNVVSMRLNDIEMPANFYVFSTDQENTKMTFSVSPTHTSPAGMGPITYDYWDTKTYTGVLGSEIAHTLLSNTSGYTITIESGTYTPCQLVDMLMGLMNEAVTAYLLEKHPLLPANFTYEHMSVLYDPVSMKLWFGNNVDGFELDFTVNETYETTCSNAASSTPYPVQSRYTHWGLGSYLGFEKQVYVGTPSLATKNFFWNPVDPVWMTPSGGNPIYYLEAPFTLCIYGPGHVYMELATYNSMDETTPFTMRSSNQYNAQVGGRHNAAFAKIPVLGINNERWFTGKEDFLANLFFSDPPLERIQKMHFKFRYHDGRLVDFSHCNLSFTLELSLLRPEIPRASRITVPPHYIG